MIEKLTTLAARLGDKGTIAGGALRSILEGNDPRDIDIFCTKKKHFKAVCKIVGNFVHNTNYGNGKSTDTTKKSANIGYISADFGMFTVIKPQKLDGRKLYGEPYELTADFDIDVTQLWMSAEGEICSRGNAPELLTKIKAREFSFTHYKDSKARIASRAAKYAGYGYKLLHDVSEYETNGRKR